MSILFVLLTFLLILTVMYFRRPVENSALQVASPLRMAPSMLKVGNLEVPKGYCFHPGHTWVLDEGRLNARVGIDGFAANLLGEVEAIEMAEPNRWVRQGQKLCTLKRNGRSVEMLSPIEGVLVSVNQDIAKTPNVVVEDPYKNGWLCVVKAPELGTNVKNLLQGPFVAPWMQNCYSRLSGMVSQLTPALAQDGGLPVKGLFFQVDPSLQQKLMKEFFLT